MICKNCGAEMKENETKCAQCGYVIASISDMPQERHTKPTAEEKISSMTGWMVAGVASFSIAVLTFVLSVSAYYDANRYRYDVEKALASTQWFDLSTICLFAGIGFFIIHYLRKSFKDMKGE